MRREQCVVRKNKERLVVGSSEDQLQGPLGHIQLCNLLPIWRIDEDLPIRHIDVPALRSSQFPSAASATLGTEDRPRPHIVWGLDSM